MMLKKWKSLFGPLAITAASVLACNGCSGHDEDEQVAPDSANSQGDEQNAAGADAEAGSTATASDAKKAPAVGGDADGSADTPGAEGASAASSNGVASADSDGSTGGAETSGATMASDVVASSEAAPAAQAAAPAAQAAAPAAQAAAPAAAPAAAGSSRVVRYIQADQTSLYAAANEQAPVTRSLDQGDILMVVEENGWGRVTDDLFVKLDSVASRAVPRSFAIPEWQAPAH